MMNFKNHNGGFTLVEVILSLAITGLVLTPIFIIHGGVFERVGRTSQAFDVIMYCKELFYEARIKQDPDAQEFTLEKGMVDFDGARTYRLEKSINQKSSLASVMGLHKESVTMTWTDRGEKKREELVTFVYKSPEQKKT